MRVENIGLKVLRNFSILFKLALDCASISSVQVMGATLDGISVNRRLLTLHGDSKVVYKTKNPYAGVLS